MSRHQFLKTGFGRQPVIHELPASFPWILATLLGVLVLPFLNPPKPAPVAPAPPPPNVVTVETQIPTEGLDSHQRRLPFTVYVLQQQFSWKLRSATDLEEGETLLSPELTDAVNQARDVFCVGTASFEGTTGTEEARAAERAGQLARWITGVIRNAGRTQVFALNAGQYRGPSGLASAYQRKAILIVTGPHDDDVELGEGLASGLKQQQTNPVVYALLHHYSRSSQWLAELKRTPPGTRLKSRKQARRPASGTM